MEQVKKRVTREEYQRMQREAFDDLVAILKELKQALEKSGEVSQKNYGETT